MLLPKADKSTARFSHGLVRVKPRTCKVYYGVKSATGGDEHI